MTGLVFRYSVLFIVSIMLSTVVGFSSLSPRLTIHPGDVADRQAVNCTDINPSCPYWAAVGECQRNPSYMLWGCGGSCNIDKCCTDTDPRCPHWASIGECKNNPGYMLPYCMKSCNPDRCACKDSDPSCPSWADAGECKNNINILFYCKLSCQQCGC